MCVLADGLWKVWPVYRVLDEDGSVRDDAVEPDISEELALKIYGNMIRLEAMDDVFYNAQRQVRTHGTQEWLAVERHGFCFVWRGVAVARHREVKGDVLMKYETTFGAHRLVGIQGSCFASLAEDYVRP